MNTDNIDQFIFAILGNVLNLAYNVPLVYQVIRNKSTRNISGTFLILRLLGSIVWCIYGGLVQDLWIILLNLVTLSSTFIIGCYKISNRREKNKEIENSTNTNNNTNTTTINLNENELQINRIDYIIEKSLY